MAWSTIDWTLSKFKIASGKEKLCAASRTIFVEPWIFLAINYSHKYNQHTVVALETIKCSRQSQNCDRHYSNIISKQEIQLKSPQFQALYKMGHGPWKTFILLPAGVIVPTASWLSASLWIQVHHPPGVYSTAIWVGGFGRLNETLTLFKTQKM